MDHCRNTLTEHRENEAASTTSMWLYVLLKTTDKPRQSAERCQGAHHGASWGFADDVPDPPLDARPHEELVVLVEFTADAGLHSYQIRSEI